VSEGKKKNNENISQAGSGKVRVKPGHVTSRKVTSSKVRTEAFELEIVVEAIIAATLFVKANYRL